MRYLFTIKNGKVKSFQIYDPRLETIEDLGIEDISLQDILIYYESGCTNADYIFQAYLEREHPYQPNKISLARKLGKYKKKT